MPVLQYVDMAIGYAFAMLVAATLVSAAVAVVQRLALTRHKELQKGLAALIGGLDPALKPEASKLAGELTSESRVREGGAHADAVAREEFILLLLRKASGSDGNAELAATIKALSGKEPEELLKSIQERLVEEEKNDPHAPSYLWRVRAIADAGAGAFAGKIFAWYDNTMDRVEDRVGLHARRWATGIGLVVCLALGLDSIDLLKRLSRDDVFRKNLVERAIEESKKTPNSTDPAKPPEKDSLKAVFEEANQTRELLHLKYPDSTRTGLRWFVGVLISWAMVSLGAAFWLGVLNKAIGLRSELGQKLEQQRAQRNEDSRKKAV